VALARRARDCEDGVDEFLREADWNSFDPCRQGAGLAPGWTTVAEAAENRVEVCAVCDREAGEAECEANLSM